MAASMDFNKECCLCLQVFTDPRVLPCLHTFCLKCLENVGATIPNDWLLCPVCGSKFTVPGEGLKGLPINVFAEKSADVRANPKFTSTGNISCDACAKNNLGDEKVAEKYCINCEDRLCLECCAKHNEKSEHLIVYLNCQEETKTEKEKETCRCRVHEEETPTLFCTFCRKVICEKCFQESHSSHSCSDCMDIVNLVCKQAEQEYENVQNMQHKFQDKRENLHRDQMKFLEKVKKIETEVLQRCEKIKELVIKETKALLQELAALKTERLQEIDMENRRIDTHLFTLEKFKEYCSCIKSKSASNYTCEAECILRHTANELKIREMSRLGNRILPLGFELQKTEIPELLMPVSSAIGKINVICQYKMETPTTIDTRGRTVHGMASLQDKLYLLSASFQGKPRPPFNSVLIHLAENPYDYFGEIKTPEIKWPTSFVSCCQTSRLYICDEENKCIWKVSVPDQKVTRWFDKVKERCAISVTPNGEVLMTTMQGAETHQPVTVEIYNQNAMLTERVELPKIFKTLQYIHVYKIPSGNYIGYGEDNLYKFRSDGSIVCQCEINMYSVFGKCVRRLEVSPYHIFLISRYEGRSSDLKGSVISFDHAFNHNVLIGSSEQFLTNLCYVKATKKLAVLEQVQIRLVDRSYTTKGVVTVYDVL